MFVPLLVWQLNTVIRVHCQIHSKDNTNISQLSNGKYNHSQQTDQNQCCASYFFIDINSELQNLICKTTSRTDD